jgi:gamma-glutamylputrescine oxidase
VAVVGGGLAGLSAALELRQRGLDVLLLEARELGYGASGRNGGQAIHGLACEQEVIEAQLGLDDARRVWDLSLEALDLLRERIARSRHRLRLAGRLPGRGLQCTQGPGP